MALKRNLLGLGTPPQVASAIAGGASGGGLTALGTTQTDAYKIPGSFAGFTSTPSGTGAQLPTCDPGDEVFVANLDASNALLVYGQLGEKVQNGSTNAGFSVAASKSAAFKKVTATAWAAILSA